MKHSGNHYWIDEEWERRVLLRALRKAGYVFPSALAEKWLVSPRHARRISHLVAPSYLVYIFDTRPDGKQTTRIMMRDITPAPKRRRRGNPAWNKSRWGLLLSDVDKSLAKKANTEESGLKR